MVIPSFRQIFVGHFSQVTALRGAMMPCIIPNQRPELGVEDVEVLCQWANCFIASVHSRPHLGFSDDLDVAPHILEVDGCMGVEYVFIHNLYECTHIQNSICI